MSVLVAEKNLPLELTVEQSVETAYTTELAEVASKLQRGLPVLIECDKDVAPFVFINIRNRIKGKTKEDKNGIRCIFIDGRPRANDQAPAMPMGLMATMVNQIRDTVRGSVERACVVLPHLDLLTTSTGGLTSEAKEVIPLMYENPELLWLGFKDPSFPIPAVIENLFLHRINLLGLARERLCKLITQKESRKFGKEFNPWSLYKHVSGVNANRLRKMLSTLDGEDYPQNPKKAYIQLRNATLTCGLEVPNIDLEKDIGGYAKIKERLKKEILDVMACKEALTDPEQIKRMESLIPRGMMFFGPPGTGKTLLAKAVATALGAAIQIVSGPELKSKWVGDSEEAIRRVFHQARQSAPSIIVFDELDSFATARGTYTGSGVEHSMVNQLLTEMDGFHKEEMVFVVGTSNFAESIDPALLRPGRFEFHLHIPYPEADDRREIIKIYDQKMSLKLSDSGLETIVKRTGDITTQGTRYSGDHINALCRAIARIRLRQDLLDKESTPALIEQALTEWIEKPKMTMKEETVLATHEAGHAVVAMNCSNAPPIDRITIASEMQWAFGYVAYGDPAHKYVQTKGYLEDLICIALGAREAEKLVLGDLSVGATSDLASATSIAREMVEVLGLGGENVGVGNYRTREGNRIPMSEDRMKLLDESINSILEAQRERASTIIKKNRQIVETLRDLLLEHKTIDSKRLGEFVGNKHKS
jgi:cell division protease FtsH